MDLVHEMSNTSSSLENNNDDNNNNIVGAVLLLQHPPVYTLGSGSTEDNLKFSPDSPPHPIFRTERGGEVGLFIINVYFCTANYQFLAAISFNIPPNPFTTARLIQLSTTNTLINYNNTKNNFR